MSSERFWIAVATSLCFLPVAWYLKIDGAQVPHEFVLFRPFIVYIIALFLLLEIPHVALVKAVWGDLDPALKGVLLVAIVSLVLLPTMRVGLANDLVMRASIPALMILAFAFAQSLSIAWNGRPALLAFGVGLVLVGAVTPVQEIVRTQTFRPFAISDCNLVTVWKKIWGKHPTIENYLARSALAPDWLLSRSQDRYLVDEPGMVCWPDIPFDPRTSIITQSNKALLQLENHAPQSRL